MNLYMRFIYKQLEIAQIWPVCNKGITQFYLPYMPQPQGVTALWLLLIVPTH